MNKPDLYSIVVFIVLFIFMGYGLTMKHNERMAEIEHQECHK